MSDLLEETFAALLLTLDEQLVSVIKKVDEQRAQYEGQFTDNLRVMHNHLLQARGSQDRIEELLRRLIILRGRILETVIAKREAVEDAEVVAVQQQNKSVEDFSSGPERNARLRAATMDQRLELRAAEKVLRSVESVLEYVRVAHRGIDGVRADLNARIRLVSVESTLER